MARLFHTMEGHTKEGHGKEGQRTRAVTAGDLMAAAQRRMQRARIFFGHGTDNARDEAAALVYHAMCLPPDAPARALRRRATAVQLARFEELLERRIRERVPLPYLTHEAWFAGLRFHVDERVLIPRSPFAELIE